MLRFTNLLTFLLGNFIKSLLRLILQRMRKLKKKTVSRIGSRFWVLYLPTPLESHFYLYGIYPSFLNCPNVRAVEWSKEVYYAQKTFPRTNGYKLGVVRVTSTSLDIQSDVQYVQDLEGLCTKGGFVFTLRPVLCAS